MNVLSDVVSIKKKLDGMVKNGDLRTAEAEDMMSALKCMPVTVDVLKRSSIALTINVYRKKFKDLKVSVLAKELRDSWMKTWDQSVEERKKKKSLEIKSERTDEGPSSFNSTSPSRNDGAVTVIKNVMCLTQRARFDISVSTKVLKFTGKSLCHEVPLDSVKSLHLLPDVDGVHHFFMVELMTPILKGKTIHKSLVFKLSRKISVCLELFMSQDELNSRFQGKLRHHMQGLEPEIVSTVFEVVVDKKIITLDSSRSSLKRHSLPCIYKSDSGHLYLLEESFVFLPKPSLKIDFDEISSLEYGGGDYGRSFDLSIGTTSKKSHNFVIDTNKHDILVDFVKRNGLT